MDTFDLRPRKALLGRRLPVLLAIAIGSIAFAMADGQGPSAKANAESSEEPGGFSIESEMLTYRALESNSEAVACDVAALINRSSVNFPNGPEGPVCNVTSNGNKDRVVLLPFDQSTFADFQIWRGDMATMQRLQDQVKNLHCSGSSASRGGSAAASAASSASSALLNLTPAGPALNLATGVMGMLASEESSSSVAGTITDQAFINAVARQLQGLKVQVIMPKAFSPHSLQTISVDDSPFLSSLAKTLDAEACLKAQKSPAADYAISSIEQFRCMLGDTVSPSSADPSGPGEKSHSICESSSGAATTATAKKAGDSEAGGSGTSTNSAADHLSAVLAADGLAQALGYNADTGEIAGEGVHLLLLKALESGGSVAKRSNILGTKLRYSGGSVGTYALFKMSGDLECSGNVFDYGGQLKAKNFERDFRRYNPDPAKQVIFSHGNCRAIGAGQ